MLHAEPEAASNLSSSLDSKGAVEEGFKAKIKAPDRTISDENLGRITHRSKKDLVYQILKDAVIDRKWHPGEKKSLNELSSILQVSRSPVAEACKLLEKEGWIIIRPQVGVEVAPISKEHIIENLKIRGVLEGLAGMEAMHHLETKDFEKLSQILGRMESAVKTINFNDFMELNHAFHRMIYKASRMNQLTKDLDQYWDDGKRYRAFYRHLLSLLPGSSRRHRRILTGLRNKDAKLVRTELEKDSWVFGEKLSKYFNHRKTAAGLDPFFSQEDEKANNSSIGFPER